MGALPVDTPTDPDRDQDWDDLVRIWEETDAPEGCKVEIIEGIGTVSPPLSKDLDLVVLPRAVATGPGNRVPAGEVRLVVEITSQANADHDRIGKTHGYAQAGIELFLLLDPWHSGRPTATLYGEPAGGTCRVLDTVEYGEKLTLPEPFGLELDTGIFPVS
ncbi:Uma2 family endonuclease [Streptomyces sp. NPDC088727]|uniref:Uma2 family endonuclease n=1 Tax=Streptomyces sp. NPDC088727 TaxID=3365875 RepID=UPI00380FD69F